MRQLFFCVLMFCTSRLHAQGTFSLNLTAPPQQLSIVSEGGVSTFMNERDFAVSPDGTEIYFTISSPRSKFQTIVFSKKINGNNWTKPEIVSFAGNFSDLEPAFSADGNSLYFASNRPISGSTPKDFDIWKVSRNKTGWGVPENLGPTINTAANEFYPSVAKSGNLYFTAEYENGIGLEDIWMAEWKSNSYQKPIVVDSAVNSKKYEFNAFVSPNEDYIIFTSYGRKDDTGGGDLYISFRTNGNWLPAVNLKELNSPQIDYCPYVSADGKSLFFTSERHGLVTNYEHKATYKSIADEYHKALNGTGNIFWIDFNLLRSRIPK